jgi:hypothetical protein
MEKHTYVVAEGIPAINGKAVPANREVELSEREALFDLSLDRISLKPSRAAGRKSRPESDPIIDDVSDEG